MTMPTFDFSGNTVTDADVAKAEIQAKTPRGKFFEPGQYTLKVLAAEFANANQKDPSWLSFKVTLGLNEDDGRKLTTYLLVPTKSAEFNAPGKKPTLFLYLKFKAFAQALGEECKTENLQKVAPKLFKDPSKLVGKVLEAKLGYERHHVGYQDGVYTILEKDGRPFLADGQPSTYADRDSAVADAAAFGITIQKFIDVTEFIKADAAEESSDNPWG